MFRRHKMAVGHLSLGLRSLFSIRAFENLPVNQQASFFTLTESFHVKAFGIRLGKLFHNNAILAQWEMFRIVGEIWVKFLFVPWVKYHYFLTSQSDLWERSREKGKAVSSTPLLDLI